MAEVDFDVGQICENGHAINGSAISAPQFNQDYCDKCGKKTRTTCPNCKTPIRGELEFPSFSEYKPPAFCHKCGNSFPWTKQKIQAVIKLSVEEDNLDKDERKQLEASVNDIVRESPRTQLEANRFKKFLSKIRVESARAVRDLIIDIVSESAKKIIWPDK